MRRWLVRKASMVPVGLLLVCVWSAAEAAKSAASEPQKTGPEAGIAVGDTIAELVKADWLQRDRQFNAPQVAGNVPARIGTGRRHHRPRRGRRLRRRQERPVGVPRGQRRAGPLVAGRLGAGCRLDRVVIYNRCDSREGRTGEHPGSGGGKRRRPGRQGVHPDLPTQRHGLWRSQGQTARRAVRRPAGSARIVRLRVPGRCSFALDEVEVYAADDPNTNLALNRPADQVSVSPYSRPGTMTDAEFRRLGYEPLVSRDAPAAAGGEFRLAHTRDQSRTGPPAGGPPASKADPSRLQPLLADLDRLDARLARLEASASVSDADAAGNLPGGLSPQTGDRLHQPAAGFRQAAVHQAARFGRRVPHVRPVLRLQRQAAAAGCSCCDDPLRAATATGRPAGRLGRGERPAAGPEADRRSFLSPELSFDGQTILFAYSEVPRRKETYQWAPEYSYHIFQVQRRRHRPGAVDRRTVRTISIRASCPTGGSCSFRSGAAATCAAAGTARCTPCTPCSPTAATSSA